MLSFQTGWLSHFGMLGLATMLVRIVARLLTLIGAVAAAVYAAQQRLGSVPLAKLAGVD